MECKNCKTYLTEESDYCNSCGGKVIRNRLTLRNLFEHFTETFFNYDNKFFQTFLYLFKNPENVIEGYINGIRKKYADVISYFTLAITISGLQLFILNKFFPDAMDMSVWSTKGAEEIQKQQMSSVQEYQSIIMMFYAPLYALIAKIVFYNIKKFNYTELLVIFLYIQAQISIASGILALILLPFFGISFGIFSMFAIPTMILYSAYCLKRLYQISFSRIVWKTLIFGIVLTIVLIIIFAVIAFIMYSSGGLDTIIEAQKAAQHS
ncbi:MAG: DUF3667 domain-containing protein [Gelidibacter sp.]